MTQRILIVLVMFGTVLLATDSMDDSASITIQGTVPASAQITVAPIRSHHSLKLVEGLKKQAVATVLELSRASSGYTITLQSANARANASAKPLLKGTGTKTARVPYLITYGTRPVTLDGTGSAVITSIRKHRDARSGTAGVQKSLYVTIDPTSVKSGTYSDTLVLTFKNN